MSLENFKLLSREGQQKFLDGKNLRLVAGEWNVPWQKLIAVFEKIHPITGKKKGGVRVR